MTSKVYFMDFRSNEDENLIQKLGEDKIRGVYPYSKHEMQLEYAQEIGIGSRDYELIKI